MDIKWIEAEILDTIFLKLVLSLVILIDDNKCSNPEKTKCWNEGWKKVKLTKVTGEDNQYQILPYDYDKTGKKQDALNRHKQSIKNHR